VLFAVIKAVVTYNYKAQHDDELTLKVGDVIHSVVKMEGGWWEGVLNGRKGVFPDNFVKVNCSVNAYVIIIIIIIKRKLKAQINRKKRHKCAAMTQLPKTVDYSAGLMSLKQVMLPTYVNF